ncbi:head-tail connector protein [Rhodopseudomonas palustris]|uniref:PhiE125 gp8 family phage protein n=1 Tax=Rhodopseudomonas palustris (strain BisB18) TaxID=316056 RepID=Q217R4_RHOPB
MSAILLVGPASEPWTLAEVKSFLRVEHDADDAVITALLAAARGQVEALTRRALLLQSWRLALDRWPADGRLVLRIAPLRAVTAARVFDAAGVAHPIDPSGFVVDAAANAIAAPRCSLPQPGRAHAGIELDLQLGFGAAAGDVPEQLRHAIRTLVAHWYDNRGLAAIGQSVALLPGSVSAMIASYRVLSL